MDQRITAIIVDDEQHAIDVFLDVLTELPEIEVVATVNNVDEAVNSIIQHKPALVFLDVEMPGKNGFELIHEIKDFKTQPCIIFVTAFNEYAIDAIRHTAFDYLLKPVSTLDLKKAIERFKQKRCEEIKQQHFEKLISNLPLGKIKFNTRSGSFFLHPDEIIYVQAEGNYTEIFLADGSAKIVCEYLSLVFEKLPKEFFFRVSRSVLINLKYLTAIDRKKRICKLLNNGQDYSIRISSKLMNSLQNYKAFN